MKKIFTQNSTTNILLRIILMLLMVIAADKLAGYIFTLGYKKMKSGPEFYSRVAAEETKADVIIIGASRAMQQYNAAMLQDSLGLTCYNAGRDGIPFFYTAGIFRMIVNRHSPKTILLDCEAGTLDYSSTGYDRISPLLPFYRSHPEIRDIVHLRHPLEKYKLASSLYPYNSTVFKILLGNISKNKNAAFNGYVPLYGNLTRTPPTLTHDTTKLLDSIKIKLLDEMIATCRAKNIQLIFVLSPYYIHHTNNSATIVHFKNVATKNNIPFISYEKDTFFIKRPALWDDTVHVNFEGSKIFTADLANRLTELNAGK